MCKPPQHSNMKNLLVLMGLAGVLLLAGKFIYILYSSADQDVQPHTVLSLRWSVKSLLRGADLDIRMDVWYELFIAFKW